MTNELVPTYRSGEAEELTSISADEIGNRGLSVIVPAFNEAKVIAQVLTELLDVLEADSQQLPFEVIVVDDGSTDRTGEVVQAFSERGVRVIAHAENRGYGAALKMGVRGARYAWIAITDADGTYPAEALEQLIKHRGTNDMVVGARTGAVSHVPFLRRFPKWCLRRLASYLVERNIPDLNSGLRIMRRSVVDRFCHILPNRFSFTTTITLAMLCSGFSVEYVKINYLKRQGKSKIRPIRDTLNFLILIIRTIVFFNPLRVFLPLSLSFFLSSLLVGVLSVLLTGQLMDVTVVVLFVTGIQIITVGMLADLVNRRMR